MRRLVVVFLLTVLPAIGVIFLLDAFSAPGEVAAGASSVRVTDGLGRTTLVDVPRVRAREGEAALALVRRTAGPALRAAPAARVPAGPRRALAALVAGERPDARWRLWVNGVRAGAAEPLRPGDQVWLDRAPAASTPGSPVVVGAWPQPFVRGFGGDRYPARVECGRPGARVCREARDVLAALGLPVAATSVRATDAAETLRLVVGTWSQVRADPAARLLERGPGASGAFVRPDPAGGRIALLDAVGRPVRDLAPDGGLLVATRLPDEPPTVLATGTSEAGVAAALRGLRPELLAGRPAAVVEGRASAGVPLAR